MDNHIAFTYTIRTQSILRSGKALMQTFAKIRFAYSGGWSRSRRLCVMFLLPTILAMPVQVFAACQQTSLPSTYITSWDSYGSQNYYYVREGRAPDTVSGKGPFWDRYDPSTGKLRLSYNVLGFQIP